MVAVFGSPSLQKDTAVPSIQLAWTARGEGRMLWVTGSPQPPGSPRGRVVLGGGYLQLEWEREGECNTQQRGYKARWAGAGQKMSK